MRGARRLAIAVWTAGLLLAPVAASAQEAPAPTTNTPAADAVGPRELQNFSLEGNVTRPAEQAPERETTTSRAAASGTQQPVPSREPAARSVSRPAQTTATTTIDARPPAVERARPQVTETAPPQQTTLARSTTPTTLTAGADVPPSSSPAFTGGEDASAPTLTPERRFSFLPWLLAALAVVAGGAFLFLRNRSRPAFAGGPQIDMFAAQEPGPVRAPALKPRWIEPTPDPQPAPKAAPVPSAPPKTENPPDAPQPIGIVSTGLRPWVDINVEPLRWISGDDGDVTIEFQLEITNSGSGPARDILLEAAVINAGPTQDEEVAAFFAREPGVGERIDVIQPLGRNSFTTRVSRSKEHLQGFEVNGRQLFVPLLVFNAFYRRGSSQAQTSVGFLLGREGKGEKLAPFRLDAGAREVRGLGARQLPQGVRQ